MNTRKVCAFVLRRGDEGAPEILALSFASRPDLAWRLPGGSLIDGESSLLGLQREVFEETGLGTLTVFRKLSIRCYHKEYIHSDVERHDYLLWAPDNLPAEFRHTVTGSGGDAGEVFEYRWLAPKDVDSVDAEFRGDLTPDYVPEFFAPTCDERMSSETAIKSSDPIVLEEYDPVWPRRFEEQRTLLEEVFGLDAQIEHIGSTAVRGLSAKPVLDIMVGLSELSEAERKVPHLAWLGYAYVPEPEVQIPERRYFRQLTNGTRRAHLHCVKRGSTDWTRNLVFRDVLRSDKAIAATYVALKQSLAAQYRFDRGGYARAKGPFIEGVLKRAPR